MTSSFPRKPLPPEVVAKIEALEKLLAEAGRPRLTSKQEALLDSLAAVPVVRSPHIPPGRIVLTQSPRTDQLFLLPEVPIRFMTGAKIPLQDKMWARFQAFRRFLWRLRNR